MLGTDESLTSEFRHPGCFKELELIELTQESVTISRAMFDKINACRLLQEPLRTDTNVKENEKDSDNRTHQWIATSAATEPYETHSQYLYVVLRRMESACATLSLVLSKSRKSIESELSAKDQEAQAAARLEARKRVKTTKELEKERKEHADRAPHTHAVAEKRKLTKEEKGIEFLMTKFGMSEADARLSVQRQSRQEPTAS